MKFTELFIATNNNNKVEELRHLVRRYFGEEIRLWTPRDFNLDSPPEDQDSFEGNAALKALYYHKHSGLPVLADDTGVCIHELKGQPGVYTADWADQTKNFKLAFERVKQELAQIGSKTTTPAATAVCVLSFMSSNSGQPINFRGEVDGVIDFAFETNSESFGFQPVFVPKPYRVPFSQLSAAQKFKISHRARAFRQFVAYLAKA